MSVREAHLKRIQDIAEKSHQMRQWLLDPIVDDGSGKIISDRKARVERLQPLTQHTIFEAAGKSGPMLHATAAHALASYCNQRGVAPRDELLASAHQAITNMLEITDGKRKAQIGNLIFESAEMSTTEGILMRDRMIALVLPVMLQMITAEMVTFVPGTYNQSEIFKIWRVAGSTFGDLTKGDKIGQTFNGQYSSMDQRKLVGTGDGTKKGADDDFKLDSETVFGKIVPFKKKSIRILHDRTPVAQDDGNGNLFGSFVVGATTITVTGTVNYDSGIVNPAFSTAPAVGIQIHTGYDVNIEKDPTLIPLVDHEMDAKTIYPHEAAIAGDTTLQAYWALRREMNLNANNMTLTAMRNLLAADKDRKHLRDMYFFAKDERTWKRVAPEELYFQEHLETMKMVLLDVDKELLRRTETSGLVGLVADPLSCVVFRSLKAPFFVPVSGYKRIPQPHYVGRLFDMWDLYEDPNGTAYTSLCYARGRNHGEAGYVAGDAIPALSFKHAMQRDLVYKDTLWELAYRDLHPFDGRNYFMNFKMTKE